MVPAMPKVEWGFVCKLAFGVVMSMRSKCITTAQPEGGTAVLQETPGVNVGRLEGTWEPC